MAKYDGKTLLMLGSNVGAIEMVEYAKENGAYTIVADNRDVAYSPAKAIANEQLMISTADDELLSEVILKRKVDGVLAGVSEFNLLQAMKLSERHGLPFYCTREQWNSVESKDGFRSLCEEYNVQCPKTYYVGVNRDEIPWDNIKYPSVLKPVDASSSRGVHICNNKCEIERNLDDAYSNSTSGRIIIEEFSKGDEFTAHYTICRGHAALACMDNRHPVAVHEGDVTTVPVARIYPSTFLEKYLEQVNPQMVKLCEGIGVDDGVLFVQGLFDRETGSFSIFEAGLRSAGETPSRFIKEINGLDYFQLLVDHSLSVQTDYNQANEDPWLRGKIASVYSFVARGAKVGEISGLEEAINAIKSVKSFESRYPVGSVTPDGDTLRQLMIRFVMICDSRQSLSDDISYLNSNIEVRDVDGRDMVIKMEPDAVYTFL